MNSVYRIESYRENTKIREPYIYVKATSVKEAIEKFEKHPIVGKNIILSIEYLSDLIE